MAGNAIIGALRVVLGADTAALETGLKQAQSKLSQFGTSIESSMKAAAASFAIIATGLGIAVKSTINEADKLGKLSQSIGFPVEELSKLKYAADLSAVGTEELGKSLGKLAKNLSTVAGGAGGPAADAFRSMGIEVRNADGSLKGQSQALLEIADKFKSYEDGAAKTALAIAIFGKAGAQMIPLLNQGSAAIRETMQEAEQLGIVLDLKTAKSAEAFNDNLTRMHAVFNGIVLQVTANMLPAFQQMSQVMIDAAKNSDLMKTVANGLAEGLRVAVSVTLGGIVAFQRLGAELSALWAILSAPNLDAVKSAWAAFRAEGDKTEAAFASLKDTVGKFWLDAGNTAAQTAEATGTKIAAPVINALNKAKDALTRFLDSTAKQTAALQSEADTVGMSAYAHDRLKIVLEAEAVAKAQNITVTEGLRKKIEDTATAYAAMAEKANLGKQLFEQTRTPAEQFGLTMEQLNGAFQRGSINAETYQRAVYRAQDQLVQADPIARGLGQSLENAFGKALEGGAKFSDILNSLLKDLLKMTATASFRMLLYGTQSGSSGGILGGLFAGFRASGGPVSSGMNYVVGEHGPELFRPNVPGQIVSNQDLRANSGATVKTVVQVNNYAGTDTETRQSRSQGPDGEMVVIDIVKRGLASGKLDEANRARNALRPRKVI